MAGAHPPPSAGNLCVVFGTIIDAEGDVVAAACVKATAVVPQAVGGAQLSSLPRQTLTDEAGCFLIELLRNSLVRFTVEDTDFDFERTVPDADSQDITTWTT